MPVYFEIFTVFLIFTISGFVAALGSFYANCAVRLSKHVFDTRRDGGTHPHEKQIQEARKKKPIRTKSNDDFYKDFPMAKIFLQPSHCMHANCARRLRFWDLLPVLSYLLLLGKCRYCRQRISIFIWLAELYPIFVFWGLFMSDDLSSWDRNIWSSITLSNDVQWYTTHTESFFLLILHALMIVLFSGHLYIHIATDFQKYHLLPQNTFMLLLISISSAMLTEEFLERIVYTLLIAFIFISLYLFTQKKRALGLGDVFLVPVFFLQFSPLTALGILQIGSLLAIVWIVAQAISGKKISQPLLTMRKLISSKSKQTDKFVQKQTSQKTNQFKFFFNEIKKTPAPLGAFFCLAALALQLLKIVL